mmetsp:Transcript_23275/g.73698  ORF Transcript_23275/g.73698 Transcript_23275/m.73698 type:complete len:131 (+) Transcript_23275:79-471(+)
MRPDRKREDPAAPRIQKAVAKAHGHTRTLAEDAVDGKISEGEFERLIIMAGITWLTRSQKRQMFRSLDLDESGKISLGEILSVAARIMELICKATAWAKEQERELKRDGRTLVQKEVLKAFWKNCLCPPS